MEKGRNQQFLLFSTIFCNLIFDFCVKTRTRFSLRDKRLFEITEVEIMRVDCTNIIFGLNFCDLAIDVNEKEVLQKI